MSMFATVPGKMHGYVSFTESKNTQHEGTDLQVLSVSNVRKIVWD